MARGVEPAPAALAPQSEFALTDSNTRPHPQHVWTQEKQFNSVRRKQIESAHPDVSKLSEEKCHSSAAWVLGIVALQTGIAAAMYHWDVSWWIVAAVAWTVGALSDHAQWTLIHELTHNAVFESSDMNLIFHVIANLPIVFPSTISFKYFHGLHHSHLNEAYGDPDVPGPLENKLFGTSALGKATWLAFFFLIQPFRTIRFKPKFGALTRWLVINWVVQMLFNVAVLYAFGLKGLLYLTLSSVFAIGLHPLGARWLAEHYSLQQPQETYSYYGSFNSFMFNVGYHNEHHDFPTIPWHNLPKVKAMAPEFYDNLWHHTSYWRLLREFLFTPSFTLHTRVVREPKGEMAYLMPAEAGGKKAQ